MNHSVQGVLKDQCHHGEMFSESFKNDCLMVISLRKDIGSEMISEGNDHELDNSNV